MNMKHEILSWLFGFLTPALILGLFIVFCAIVGSWIELPAHHAWLNSGEAYAGAWLFGAVLVIAGVIVWRIYQ
jgi:hypothetical protein